MTTNFNITLEGTEFEFISMNRVRLQAFQVYVLVEQKKQDFTCRLTITIPKDFTLLTGSHALKYICR